MYLSPLVVANLNLGAENCHMDDSLPSLIFTHTQYVKTQPDSPRVETSASLNNIANT